MTNLQNLASGPPYSPCLWCPTKQNFKKQHSYGLENGKSALNKLIKQDKTRSSLKRYASLPDSKLFLYKDQDITVTRDIEVPVGFHIVVWFNVCGYFNVSEIHRDFPDLYNKVYSFICNDLKSALKLPEIKIWSSEREIVNHFDNYHAHFQVAPGDKTHVPQDLYEITKLTFKKFN
jgi:hypothetical protein